MKRKRGKFMSYTFDQIASKFQYGNVKMSVAGCGPCSVASIAYNLNESNKLHEAVLVWLASRGHMPAGTTRDGLTKGMKAYLLNVEAYSSVTFNPIMDGIARTGYGVLLMYGTSKGKPNDYWTHGGHYISITEYDPINDSFYVRDSGARKRTGWHKRSEFKACFVSGWVLSFEEKDMDKPTVPKYTLYKGSKGAKVEYLQQCLNYCGNYGLVVDGSMGPKTVNALKDWQSKNGLAADGSYGPKSYGVMFKLLMA